MSVLILFFSFLHKPLVAQPTKPGSTPEHSIQAWALSPEVLRNAREELARNTAAGFQKQGFGLKARLEGTNHDVLVIEHPQLMGRGLAEDMIRGFDDDPATNFWNGLRLFGYK